MSARQFKFRAWDTVSKRYRDEIPIIEAWWDTDAWDDAEQAMEAEHIVFDPANPLNTFGGRLVYEQWTGLTDSVGKEIYEGDVVRVKEHDFYHERDSGADREGGVWEGVIVIWANCGFRLRLNEFRFDEEMSFAESIEITGNIHENRAIGLAMEGDQ